MLKFSQLVQFLAARKGNLFLFTAPASIPITLYFCPGTRGFATLSLSPTLSKGGPGTAPTDVPKSPSTSNPLTPEWKTGSVSKSQGSMRKRIIVCCDGTWQTSTSLFPEYTPSNVTRLYRLIARGGTGQSPDTLKEIGTSLYGLITGGGTKQQPPNTLKQVGIRLYHHIVGPPLTQVIYYNGGVGSDYTDSLFDIPGRLLAGLTGRGLLRELVKAYHFIVNNYYEHDELLFFGFSRGAFTVRSVAGMISDIGILTPESMPYFFTIFRIYQKKNPETPIEQVPAWQELTKQHPEIRIAYSPKDIDIPVIGVWDTVGAQGIPDIFPFKFFKKNYDFLITGRKPPARAKHAFQALALDEDREPYKPTLWTLQTDKDDHPTTESREVCQVWFPGAHINVGGGGGSPGFWQWLFSFKLGKLGGKRLVDTKKNIPPDELSNISLAWMLDRVQPYLALEWQNVEKELGIPKDSGKTPYGSGNIWEGDLFWKVFKYCFGTEPRTAGKYHHDGEYTNEWIHPSVHHRQMWIEQTQIGLQEYKPKGLGGRKRHQMHGDRMALWGDPGADNGLWEFQIEQSPNRSAEFALMDPEQNLY